MAPSDAPQPADAGRAPPSGQRTAQPVPGADLYLACEQVVDRLARLALHAHALADRIVGLPPPTAPTDPSRAERIRRLRAGADLACRALAAATRLDLAAVTITGSDGACSRTVDRRRAQRRVARPASPASTAPSHG